MPFTNTLKLDSVCSLGDLMKLLGAGKWDGYREEETSRSWLKGHWGTRETKIAKDLRNKEYTS